MSKRGELLADYGYTPDPGRVEHVADAIVFYHYTREEHVEKILRGGGLRARLSLVSPPPDLYGLFLVEGLLEPLPQWMADSPHFGDLGLEMMREYVGDTLLRIEVPHSFNGLYVADYAHVLECKHISRRGQPALNLGYDCRTGRETTKADANSYIPAMDYRGGHVAPGMKATRPGKGIAVPAEYISMCDVQPLKQSRVE